MKQNTHQKTSKELIGEVVSIQENKAIIQLKISDEMLVDEYGLSHGGFTFGLADYAAMVAINHPNVVLGKAAIKFIKPTVKGDLLTAEANVVDKIDNTKSIVSVTVRNQHQTLVFEGEFVCFSLDKHILENPDLKEGYECTIFFLLKIFQIV